MRYVSKMHFVSGYSCKTIRKLRYIKKHKMFMLLSYRNLLLGTIPLYKNKISVVGRLHGRR
jgi:hypothetical protein